MKATVYTPNRVFVIDADLYFIYDTLNTIAKEYIGPVILEYETANSGIVIIFTVVIGQEIIGQTKYIILLSGFSQNAALSIHVKYDIVPLSELDVDEAEYFMQLFNEKGESISLLINILLNRLVDTVDSIKNSSHNTRPISSVKSCK